MTLQRIYPNQIFGVPAPGEVPWTASFPSDGLVTPVTGLSYTVSASQFPVVVKKAIAITAAVTMTDSGTGASAAGIGFSATVTNNIAGLQKVWGFYTDVSRTITGTGNASGGEVQITTLIPSPHASGMTPYKTFLDGQTRGIGIGAGSDETVMGRSYAVDMAMMLNTNGAAFWRGLVFRFDSIMREGMTDDRTKPGNSGYAHAINLAHEQGITLFSRDPLTGGGTDQADVVRIYSTIDSAVPRHILYWTDNAMVYGEQEGTGSPLVVFDYISNAANYVGIKPGAAGQGVSIEARGTNTNVALSLVPKGVSPVFIPLANVVDYASDAAAAAGGLSIGSIYRTSNTLKIRIV